jgi:hypothetical protein
MAGPSVRGPGPQRGPSRTAVGWWWVRGGAAASSLSRAGGAVAQRQGPHAHLKVAKGHRPSRWCRQSERSSGGIRPSSLRTRRCCRWPAFGLVIFRPCPLHGKCGSRQPAGAPKCWHVAQCTAVPSDLPGRLRPRRGGRSAPGWLLQLRWLRGLAAGAALTPAGHRFRVDLGIPTMTYPAVPSRTRVPSRRA